MPEQILLSEVDSGCTVRVLEILGGHNIIKRLQTLGIRPGVKVKKLGSGVLGRGPSLLQHGQAQTALGYGVCKKIVVELVK